MSLKSKRSGIILALAIAFVFVFASVASAAVPQYIYFENSDGDIVKADYSQAISQVEAGNNDMYNTIKAGIIWAQDNGKLIIVQLDDGKVIDWAKALSDGVNFSAAQENDNYLGTLPEFDKIVDGDGNIVDRPQPPSPGPSGTYTISEHNSLADRFTLMVQNLDNARYYNVSRNGEALSNNPVAITGEVVSMKAMLSDPAILTVEFYSDAEGGKKLATATLDGTGKLIIVITPSAPSEPIDGNYEISSKNSLADKLTVQICGIEARYFNVFRNGEALSNNPVAITGEVVSMKAMLSNPAILTIEFYNDAEGAELVATATLDGAGKLVF